MKRKNLKKAAELEADIEKLTKELEIWEKAKAFNASSIIQIKDEVYGMNPKYANVDLNLIPFTDLRSQLMNSLNHKIEGLEKELEKLLNDEN